LKYRKIDPRIWNDAKFRALSDKGKLVFLFLLTHPHLTSLGAMRGTLAGLSEELGWPEKAFREAFMEAFRKGLIKADFEASFIAFPNFLKYNKPENPNVVKHYINALDVLPECDELSQLIQCVKVFVEGLGKAFSEALPKPFRAPLAILELELEPELELELEPKQERGVGETDLLPKIQFGEFVQMRESEYAKLVERFGQTKTDDLIESENSYAGSLGIKKYQAKYPGTKNTAYYRILSAERYAAKTQNGSNGDDKFNKSGGIRAPKGKYDNITTISQPKHPDSKYKG